jgi:hypothetical protein
MAAPPPLAAFIMLTACASAPVVRSGDAAPALRRPVSTARPLFMLGVGPPPTGPAEMLRHWRGLPDDIRPFWVYQLAADLHNKPESTAWLTAMAAGARALGGLTRVHAYWTGSLVEW